MSSIAERLLLIRGKTKQGAFADLLGINPNTLRSYENGRSCPNQELLEQLCVQFSVSAEWLLLGRGPMHTGESTPEPELQAETQSKTPDTAELRRELEEERRERRALADENRELMRENRRQAKKIEDLLEDNSALREENGIMRERLKLPAGAGKVGSNVA